MKKRLEGFDFNLSEKFGFKDFNLKDNYYINKVLPAIILTSTLIFTLIVLIPLALAAFQAGTPSHSIGDVYGAGENIRGWINISLSNEPGNSVFQASKGNSISLINLLKADSRNAGTYACNPLDCESDYSAGNPQAEKTFSLPAGNSTTSHGLVLTGNIQSVESVKFVLESNAPISSKSQIRIDLFNDGTIDILNNKTCQGAGCDNIKSYGCWFDGLSQEEYAVEDGNPFCQKMNLSEAPGFALGAWVKNISGARSLKAELYNSQGTQLTSCNLPPITSSEGAEYSCNVNYTVKETGEYFVCFYPTSGTGNFRMRGYSVTNGCGFRQFPPSSSAPAAYQVFAESKKFDAPGILTISNTLPDGNALGSMIQGYIQEKYGSLNCGTDGCVIPIKLTSTTNQDITIKNLEIVYRKDGSLTTQTNFYDVTETAASVSSAPASSYQRIYLDAGGFKVPEELGKYEFTLELNGNEVFSEEVNVSDIPRIISLKPTATAAAFPTEFTAGISSSSVSKYFWDFGDNSTQVITTENSVIHAYPAIGTYQMTVRATDSRGLGSARTFEINVSSPKDLINMTLGNLRRNVNVLNIQIGNFSLFTQQSIDSVLNLGNASTELTRIETAFNNATTEAQYNQIIADLLKLNVPNSVFEGNLAERITFLLDPENVDLSVIQQISGGTYTSEQEKGYKNGVVFWNQENLDTRVTFREIVGEYETSTEALVRVFELDIQEKTAVSENYFLVLPKLENLKFASGITAVESGNYVYVDMGRVSNGMVLFSTTQEGVDFTNVPAFISPPLSSLSILEILPEEEDSRLTILILAIALLLIVAFITYLVLQQWYKKRYENYLFKNKNDLYNMVTYINNAKKRGLKKSEIESNLKKAKWGSEQIRYVMKKYAGRRTGMAEIPFPKFIDKKLEEK